MKAAKKKRVMKPRKASKPAGGAMQIRLGVLTDVIGFNLRMAQDASFRAFARHSGEEHLKPGRFAALMVIHNNPGLTQMDLGRAIARDKSSVTPLIQELQRHGLVERRQSKTDRRSITLKLTRAGEKATRVLLGHAMEHDKRLDAIVGERKAEFVALLKKIADEIT
jgi:DNA-binding MarR family transcriptional regulator